MPQFTLQLRVKRVIFNTITITDLCKKKHEKSVFTKISGRKVHFWFSAEKLNTETTRMKQEIMMMQAKKPQPARACLKVPCLSTYFNISEKNPRIAMCNTCYAEISRTARVSLRCMRISSQLYFIRIIEIITWMQD